MAITEDMRHKIYEAFRSSFGNEVANGMMEMLPPVGWADVATKNDLLALEQRLELRFDLMDARFARVDDKFDRVDERIELAEARMGERLERALRVQSARSMGAMAAMFVAFGLVDRLVLG